MAPISPITNTNNGNPTSSATIVLGSPSEKNHGEALPPFTKYFLNNLRRLSDFRRKTCFVDTKLRGIPTGNEESEPRILVHRIILVMNSPYFEKLVKKGKFTYHVPIPPVLLDDLVTYMYTGEMPIITTENALELLKACQLLELSEAFEKCRDFLTNKLLAIENFNADFLLNNCPPDLANSVLPSLFDNFEKYSSSQIFHQLSLEQLDKLVSLGRNLPLGSFPTETVLKGLLNWVLADVKDRQKHFLPLMQTLPLTDIPADLMKQCVITLNTSYQSVATPSSSNLKTQELPAVPTPNLTEPPGPKTSDRSKHLDSAHQDTARAVERTKNNTPQVLFTFSSTEKSDETRTTGKNKLGKIPKIKYMNNSQRDTTKNDTEPIPMELSDSSNPPKLPSTVQIVNKNKGLPAFVTPKRRLSPFKAIPVVSLEKLVLKNASESLKRESQFDETLPISERLQSKKIRLAVSEESKKEIIKLDSTSLKQSSSVAIKLEPPQAQDDFEIGSIIEDISAYHPLMFYLCEEPRKKYSIRAYDFREKKSAVVIDNALVDRYNYGMALKGQTILLIGGRNDSSDFLGSDGHECLSSVISFEKFLHISNDKIRVVKYPDDSAPNYANHCLKQPRSNFGMTVRGNKIFAIGGHAKTNTPLRSLKSTEMFDSELGSWKLVAPMQEHREHFGLTWLNSSIYVAGGFKASTFSSALNSVEEYVPETNTWNSAPPLCTKSIGPRLVTSDTILYALEGGTQHSWERRNNYEILDLRVGKWTASKPSKVTRLYRRGAGAACINGNIYSIGGYTNGSVGSPVVEMLDPRNEAWCVEGELPKGGVFTSVSFMNL